MSRDCKNNSKFIFGVDYRRLIKEKSRFGNLLNTTYLDVLNDLLSATLIRDMKIFRINARDYPGIISSTSDVGAESTRPGSKPITDFLGDQLAVKEDGGVVVDDFMATSTEGVWAIGDIRNTPFKQAVVAASDGCISAMAIDRFLNSRKAIRVDWVHA